MGATILSLCVSRVSLLPFCRVRPCIQGTERATNECESELEPNYRFRRWFVSEIPSLSTVRLVCPTSNGSDMKEREKVENCCGIFLPEGVRRGRPESCPDPLSPVPMMDTSVWGLHVGLNRSWWIFRLLLRYNLKFYRIRSPSHPTLYNTKILI